MAFSITSALKGINGTFEVSRLIGGIGGLVYVIGTHVFIGYEVMWRGEDFDIINYCLAFPTGLAAIGGGTAASVALKDRNVASAKVITETGTVPAKPTEGPRVPVGTNVSDNKQDEPSGPAGPTMLNQEADLAP